MGKGQKRAPLRKQEVERKAVKLSEEARPTTTDDHSPNSEGDEEYDEKNMKQRVASDNDIDSGSDSDSDSDSESDEDLALDGTQGEIVDMSFDFNDMKEEYAHGIAKMLKHLSCNEPETVQLADVICKQDIVGTVVCCDDGDDVFAYATVLPLLNVKNDENFGQIISELLTACTKLPSSENKETLLCHLNGAKCASTGLFLHGRFMNLPLQLCGALHSNLVEDLTWSKDSSDSDPNDFKGMEFVLALVPCSMEKGQEVAKLSCVDITGNNTVIFDSFEDDIYFQESVCTYAFNGSKSERTLACVLVKVDSLPSCVSQLQAMTAV